MTLAHDIHHMPRTQDVLISQNITFDTMLLASETLQGLRSSGFYKPSPIQLHGIPLGKCGFDLLLEAKSGTGKTAVFTVIALEKLDLKKGLQVVILAPTREIAAQISDVIKHIGSKYEGLLVEVVMGGLPVQEDIEKFKRNVHIVVASPGRLRHLIQDKHINTSAVRLLILDEADKLVEKSFQDDVKHIFSSLPAQKQVIMSSATYTEIAKTFIKNYVQNAQHVCPDSNCILLGVNQKMSVVKYNSNIVKQTQNRLKEVLKIFSKIPFKQCLIFCNYQVRVSEIHKLLLHAKWPAEQLYGNQEQTDRLDALKTLQEYKCRILIATDLAARGIDASNVDLVINFEPPFEWQTYLHRIGRAGRYGSFGMAITILSEGVEEKKFHMMLEPMKETINMTDLWCQGEISINKDGSKYSNNNASSNGLNTNKETHNEFNKLWKILISDENIKTERNLESFENLCSSFNENSLDIETFDELLQSFESNKLNKHTDLIFKHIDLNSVQSKDIWISLKLYINIILEENSHHINKINDKIDNQCFEECESLKSDQKEQNINSVNIVCKTIPSIENGNRYHDDNYNTSINNIENCKDTNETDKVRRPNYCRRKSVQIHVNPDNSKQALLDAGLPTEFGKSSKNRNPQFYLTDKQNKPNALVNSEKSNIESYSSYRDNNTSHIKSKTKNKYSDNNNSITLNTESSKFNNSNCKHIKCKCNIKCNKTKSSDYISGNYTAWYRQLKFQTKQIQLAVYIDELSKL